MTERKINSRFLLRARPHGAFDPAALQFVQEPAPTPEQGQALIRTLYLSLDPSNRIWMGE